MPWELHCLALPTRAGVRLPLRRRVDGHRGSRAAAGGRQPHACAARPRRADGVLAHFVAAARRSTTHGTVSSPTRASWPRSFGRMCCSTCWFLAAAPLVVGSEKRSAPAASLCSHVCAARRARCGAPTAWPVDRCLECSGRRLAFASAPPSPITGRCARCSRRGRNADCAPSPQRRQTSSSRPPRLRRRGRLRAGRRRPQRQARPPSRAAGACGRRALGPTGVWALGRTRSPRPQRG